MLQTRPATRHMAPPWQREALWGGAGGTTASFRPSPVLQAFSAEGSQMSKSGLRWVPDAEESLSKTRRPQQGREPHWPPGAESQQAEWEASRTPMRVG